jgi:DNA-binding response OmpR family regulator
LVSLSSVFFEVPEATLPSAMFCTPLRARGAAVPVLFLTAKGEEIDKVVGLKLGADDCVTKPFGVHELLARVEALLRRARMENRPAGKRAELPPVFRFGGAEIDRRGFSASVAGRGPVSLTARELKLLEVFAAHPGEVLTRDALLNAVWGVNYFGTTRTLDQHVAQLRKKVERDPESPEAILTVHGVGCRHGLKDH